MSTCLQGEWAEYYQAYCLLWNTILHISLSDGWNNLIFLQHHSPASNIQYPTPDLNL